MPDLKASILIVDDEESLRTSFAEIFRMFGHSVRCASDGLAALVEIEQEKFCCPTLTCRACLALNCYP
jgi:CheY-like chemotaxis protein